MNHKLPRDVPLLDFLQPYEWCQLLRTSKGARAWCHDAMYSRYHTTNPASILYQLVQNGLFQASLDNMMLYSTSVDITPTGVATIHFEPQKLVYVEPNDEMQWQITSPYLTCHGFFKVYPRDLFEPDHTIHREIKHGKLALPTVFDSIHNLDLYITHLKAQFNLCQAHVNYVRRKKSWWRWFTHWFS